LITHFLLQAEQAAAKGIEAIVLNDGVGRAGAEGPELDAGSDNAGGMW